MNVSDALATRISCRAFLDTPVSEETVRDILDRARKCPSGGNLQPWRVHVLMGRALAALVEDVRGQLAALPIGEPTEYDIYPPDLKEPYHGRRFRCGRDLYESVGVAREDRPARIAQFQRNFSFFGAPVGMIVSIDRTLGPPQWSDVGMYILAVMLLARERGLHTCAQEAWAGWHSTVARHVGLPAEEMVFCGLALGHMDEAHPVNALRTERASLEEIATFHR